jgi:thioredoxin-related protein
MKKLLALFALVAFTAAAAPLATTTPKGWLDDLAAAKKAAQKAELPIMACFTGSDWCPYCKELKSNVFDRSTFQDYAKKNVVLLYVDVPKNGLTREQVAANQKLCNAYEINGYPTVMMLNADGKKIKTIDNRDLDKFMKELKDQVESYRKEVAKEKKKDAENKKNNADINKKQFENTKKGSETKKSDITQQSLENAKKTVKQ